MKRRWKHFDPNALGWTLSDKRNFNRFLKWPTSFEGYFPVEEDVPEFMGSLWHEHIPNDYPLSGERSSRAVRKVVIQTLLDACATLVQNKPSSPKPSRVIASIVIPHLSQSSIDVYLDEDDFNGFFDRAGYRDRWTFQEWVSCGPSRSLIQEWDLVTRFPERGCYTYIREDTDGRGTLDEEWGEVWTIGEIE